MKNTLVLAVVLVSACGGSTDEMNGSGGNGGGGNGGAVDGGAGSGATGALGGNAGASGAAGASGSSGGGGISGAAGAAGAAASGGTGASAQCDALEQQHDAALDEAKKCSLLGAGPQCDFPVDRTVYSCGYYDNVEGSNTTAIAELAQLKSEWKTLGCTSPVVCALGGYPAQLATCKPSGQGGDTGICTVN